VSDVNEIRFDLFQKRFFLRAELYIHSRLLEQNLPPGLIQHHIWKFIIKRFFSSIPERQITSFP
ncbi:MAG: hypothetical protein PVF30_09035, partial [Desulfobacterales bacterium]